MIPTAKEWTVIVSKQAGAWGSYGYDAKEDALRVTVTPQANEAFVERLAYAFDDPTDTRSRSRFAGRGSRWGSRSPSTLLRS